MCDAKKIESIVEAHVAPVLQQLQDIYERLNEVDTRLSTLERQVGAMKQNVDWLTDEKLVADKANSDKTMDEDSQSDSMYRRARTSRPPHAKLARKSILFIGVTTTVWTHVTVLNLISQSAMQDR